MRRYADFRESQHRTVLRLLDIENGNRVMIRPPTHGAPCLNNLRSRLQREVKAGDVAVPGREPAGNLRANDCLSPESAWCFFESISNS
jgi:hypothetical protein